MEVRLSKMEAQLSKLGAENEALKAQLTKLDERAQRFVTMPDGCRSGTTNGISLGVSERFHRNSFSYLTCGGQ